MSEILKYILVAVEAVLCILLIGIVLLQKTKGEGGLGMSFGGGMGEALFGSRAGNVLTKATAILATSFMVVTLILAAMFSGQRGNTQIQDELGVGQAAQQAAAQSAVPAQQPAAAVPPGTLDGSADAMPMDAAPAAE